jgi:hypothetical protein
MPDTADHRAEMFLLGRERQNAGLPVWDKQIDLRGVFHNDSMSFEERRDAVVRRLRASVWLAGRDEFDRLVEIVDNLAAAEDTAEFAGWWDELYDDADCDRVWITTR